MLWLKEENFLISQKKNDLRTYKNIWKIAASQGDYYTTDCLLDYPYFKQTKKHYKIIAIDLTKQRALDADPKAIQQINFTWNLERGGNTEMLFLTEKPTDNILDFS